jgi:hypothetical protein
MPAKPTADQLAKLRAIRSRSSSSSSSGSGSSSSQNSGRRLGADTGHGRRLAAGGDKDYPALPFTDRTVVASLDKPEEQKAYLEKKYGEGSVRTDRKGQYVDAGGKKMRVSTGLAAEVTAVSPELVLGTAGAAAGAPEGGPIGAVAGAAAGGMAGKAIKEAVKSATGLQRQTPGEIVTSVERAGEANAIGEGSGKALGLLRKIPGRAMVFGTTPETKAMTDKMLKGGARPPPASTTPDARKLQRITILADKLSGPNKNIDRANFGYLQDRASEILNKAGVTGAAKDETMKRLTQAESAMSFQDTGKLIQNNAKYMLSTVKGKDLAYLKELSANSKTPEDAYRWLVSPGQTDRLERFVKVMGKNSAVVDAVQQRALRELLSGALVRTETGEATGALEKSLSQFTTKQQRMLFPNGLDKDIRTVAKEIGFLYPKIKDPAMAGFTAGTIMQKVWYDRFYAQATYAMLRAFIQKPAIIRRLAIGLDGSQPSRQAAKKAIKGMFYFGALETTEKGQDPSNDPRLQGK